MTTQLSTHLRTHGRAHANDVELAYDVRGAGPWLLLLMGLGGRAEDWSEPFTERLARSFRVLRVDNRGAGRSAKPDGPYSIELLAADAVAVLDAVGAIQTHVVGFSMGGMIAQELALLHGARVDRLVLLSTHEGGSAVVPPTEAAFAALRARGRDARAVVRGRVAAFAAPGWADAHPQDVDELARIALEEPMPMSAFLSQAHAVAASDRAARVPTLPHPTLVMHGTRDALVPPANGERLARAIPGARLVMLPDVGHLPMWEAPDALATAIEDFLGEVE